MLKKIFQFVFVAAVAPALWAQAGSTTSTPGTLNSATTEPVQGDLLNGGIRGSAMFDDNLVSSSISGRKLSGVIYDLDPSIGWQHGARFFDLLLQYAPGVSISNHHRRNHDIFKQAATVGLNYHPSQRMSVALNSDFTRTTNPFQITPSSAPSTVNNGTQFVTIPFTNRTGLVAGLDGSYLIDRFSTLGVSGSYSQTLYGTPPNAARQLINSRTFVSKIFYDRRITRRNSLGVEYDRLDQRFEKPPSLSLLNLPNRTQRSLTHSMVAFYQLALNPKITLALFGGPEWTTVHDQLTLTIPLFGTLQIPFVKSGRTFAGGATFAYKGERDSAKVSFSRQAGSGGGLLASVEATTITGDYTRELSPLWNAGLQASYGNSSSLSQVSGSAKIKHISGDLSLSRKLTRDMSVQWDYRRIQQENIGLTLARLLNHNQVSMSLQYSFSRPLGR